MIVDGFRPTQTGVTLCSPQEIIPARDPKQCGGAKGDETSDGEDDDDDTEMRAQRSRHMKAHESRHMAMGQNLWCHIWVDEHPFTIYFDVR